MSWTGGIVDETFQGLNNFEAGLISSHLFQIPRSFMKHIVLWGSEFMF